LRVRSHENLQSDWVEECLVHYLEFALPRTQLSSFYFQSRRERIEVFFLKGLLTKYG
jgi:hypothetical protein